MVVDHAGVVDANPAAFAEDTGALAGHQVLIASPAGGLDNHPGVPAVIPANEKITKSLGLHRIPFSWNIHLKIVMNLCR